MWLPHCISVFLWVINLTFYASTYGQDRPSSAFWFPYDVENGFLCDANKYQSGPVSRTAKLKAQGFLVCFSSPSTSEPTALEAERKPLEYFRTEYPKVRSTQKGLIILRQSIDYLAQKESLSLRFLELWCKELEKIVDEELKMGEEVAIIIYGLHTLYLKNCGKHDQQRLIWTILDKWMVKLEFWNRMEFPKHGAPVWYQEMFSPEEGLSKELVAFDILNEMLLKEPILSRLSEKLNGLTRSLYGLALEMSKGEIIQVYDELVIISQIFFSEPALQHISSQTRVTAIALLFHAMKIPLGGVDSRAREIGQSILSEKGFYLFKHEEVLLSHVVRAYNQNDDLKKLLLQKKIR